MSLIHMGWAWGLSLDPMAKLLLLSLADRANRNTGQCWPSVGRIAEDTGMSARSVQIKMNLLEDQGLITRTQKRGAVTLYTLNATLPQPPQNMHPDTSTTCAPTPAGDAPLPPQELHPNRKKNPKDSDTVSISMGAGADNVAFEEFWAAYPRKSGKGAARRSFASAMKKATLAEVMDAVSKYATIVQTKEKQFIAMPSTWLNGERWLDEDEDSGNWGALNLDNI